MSEDREPSVTEKRQWMSRGRWKRLLVLAASAVPVLLIALGIWLFRLDQNIKTRFAEKRFAPPIEFYSAPETIRPGSTFSPSYFETLFARKNFRRREFGQPVQPGDYSIWTAEQCLSVLPSPAAEAPPPVSPLGKCIAFRNNEDVTAPRTESTTPSEETAQIIALGTDSTITGVYTGAHPQPVAALKIEPELFAQYYGDMPILRDVVSLGTVPTHCLNALLAIEDSRFLEHSGVSPTGLLRALWTDLRSGKRKQGGSTITQQLVKNYFLSDEKTLRRKLTEIAMAFLVERRASKDEILETYINLIYMGQNGPFQVRGFSAASDHYFGKPLSDLELNECALMAAILNSPGLYDPFAHPERALKRRGLVLDRMLDLQLIDEEQMKLAMAAPLPRPPKRGLTEPAPYFVQAVRRDVKARGLDESEGLRIYTTLNLRAQEAAHQAIRAGLDRLESTVPQIKKIKASGKNLEAVIVAADPATGAVEALVGGRGYRMTQFNRAIDSRRQVGSVMKPFVYLTAFETQTPDGKPYTPLTPLADKATTYKFEGQTWTPRNYDGTYNGDVPLYWALKESLNAATVSLAMSVGLDNTVEMARRLGVSSKIAPLPSLSLGAFELSPMEVLQSYSSMAALGVKTPLTLFTRIIDLSGQELYRYEGKPEHVVASESAAELVGVMKQTLITGTGRGARAAGFTHPAAGKTGTTNDKKDAWFAGFTPYHTAIVWVGYDDNTSHQLTGASGAVPIWTSYMKSYAVSFPPDDFPWPAGVEKVNLNPDQLSAFGVPTEDPSKAQAIELIFKKGQAPATSSSPFDSSSFGP